MSAASNRLAPARLANAWRAVSRGLQPADDSPQFAASAMLEALAGVAGALAARLYYPVDDGLGEAGEFTAVAEWCWALSGDGGEGRMLSLALDPAAEGLLLLTDRARDLPLSHPPAWALLPLPHGGRIAGVLLLACPALPQTPDYTTPDYTTREALLLAARQAGCAIAAMRAWEALEDAARMSAFHRALAFATHDIKGISSQLSLLATNAERLGDNPDFRADMLITLRAAAGRLDALMAQLSRGAGQGEPDGLPVAPSMAGMADIGDIARGIAASLAPRHTVSVIEREACAVIGDAAAVAQLLTHLVNNAVEASKPDAPVFVGINADGAMVRVEVIDSGRGMSPEFLSTRLFRPFDTSKPGGFGIGAYEAREMVRAMGGRLDVESREGVGTRFVIRLPRAARHNASVAAL